LRVIRSAAIAGIALLSIVTMSLAWTGATAVRLTASALIMGGTEHPLNAPTDRTDFVTQFLRNVVDRFIGLAAAIPTGTGGAPIKAADGDIYAVTYPAEFFPVFGWRTFEVSVREGIFNLNLCVRGALECGYNTDANLKPGPPLAPPAVVEDLVVFGYSQSAVAASLVKLDLRDNPRAADSVTSFFLLANPMRPNGGILALGPQGFIVPLLGIPFFGPASTDSCAVKACMATVDASAQYDILGGDSPSSLTNVLALVNAIADNVLLHGNLQYASFEDAVYQGSHGDTDYYS
jgi:hypothetical protein